MTTNTPGGEVSRLLHGACAHVALAGRPESPIGTAYFVAPNLSVTCRHVTEGRGALCIVLPDGEHPVVVVECDHEADVAILRVECPPAEYTLRLLGNHPQQSSEWMALGFPAEVSRALASPVRVAMTGSILDLHSTTPDGRAAYQLSVPQLSGNEDIRGFSGAPIVDGTGTVLGHIRGFIPGANGTAYSALYASPAPAIRRLVDGYLAKADSGKRGFLAALNSVGEAARACAMGIADPKIQAIDLLESLVQAMNADALDLRYSYLGPRCAKNWIELSNHALYGRGEFHSQLIAMLPRLADRVEKARRASGSDLVSLVSLGCGDGVIDKQLIDGLSQTCGQLACYVPVDISAELIQRAVGYVRNAHRRIGLFFVLADLERLSDVRAIWPRSPSIEIYSMLGYTLGNLRRNDTLDGILRALGTEDMLLVDARCYTVPIDSVGEGVGAELGGELMRLYRHAENEQFVSGALTHVTNRKPHRSEFIYDAELRLGEVRGIRVRTKLRLDAGWRRELNFASENDQPSLTLGWTTAYDETSLETWFRRRGLGFEKLRFPRANSMLSHNVYVLFKEGQVTP